MPGRDDYFQRGCRYPRTLPAIASLSHDGSTKHAQSRHGSKIPKNPGIHGDVVHEQHLTIAEASIKPIKGCILELANCLVMKGEKSCFESKKTPARTIC
jgi:hypothetical protein